MLDSWLRWIRPPAVATALDFATFLDRNAWLVSQKSVIGYCTVKTKLPVHELLKEEEFARAYDRAIWEAYAAALADLTVVAQGYLSRHAPDSLPALGSRLCGSVVGLLAAHPLPPHRPEGWDDAVTALAARLREAAAAPPLPIREIALTGARRIVDTLPIHQRLRAPDEPAVMAGIQFLMVGLAHQFEKRLDLVAVAADLLGKETASGAIGNDRL